MQPAAFTAPDGEHVFVLGADGVDELAVLSGGDYAEVRQVVDLTAIDFVGATMDTVGVAMSQHQGRSGWEDDSDDLFHFDFDVPTSPVYNRVEGGFNLLHVGDVRVATETYSPEQTYCRQLPVAAAGPARLEGANTPQAFPASLAAYSIQWWQRFNTDDLAASSGYAARVLSWSDGTDGVTVDMVGVTGPGARDWHLRVTHESSGVPSTVLLPNHLIAGDSGVAGWRQFTLRYDAALPFPNELELFDGSNLVDAGSGWLALQPGQPNPAAPIRYGEWTLFGDLDRVRVLDRWMSNADILASYNEATQLPTPVDFNWSMRVLIDGAVYAERTVAPGERRRWTDFKVPARHLVGEHEVAFRLEFEEA